MDFLDYSPEDFVMNTSFYNYCLRKNGDDIDFWTRWISDHPQKMPEFEQAKEMVLFLMGQQDRQAFQKAFEAHTQKKSGSLKKWIYATAAAAVVLGIVLISNKREEILQPASIAVKKKTTESTGTGERRSIELADGSTVMLNAGSTLDVSSDFNNHTREITLNGEAYFNVTHNSNKPFVIHTSSMDVKVLGTVFDIKAYSSDKVSETSLIRGSIEITLKNRPGKKLLLHPNQKIILPNEPLAANTLKDQIKPEQKPYKLSSVTYNESDSSMLEVSWMENRMAFNDNNFEQIAKELERWYGVNVKFEGDAIRQYTFTAIFAHKTINDVLDALKLSRPFNYEIKGKEVVIQERNRDL